MKAVWLELPGKDMTLSKYNRLKIKARQLTGIVDVFHETTAKTFGRDNNEIYSPVLKKVAEIVPVGKAIGDDYVETLTKHYSFSGHKGKANIIIGSERIEIQASLSPYALAGFFELPEWLVAYIDVSVYIDGNLALKHKF